MLLNHGDIIKQEDECYNGHGWEIVPSSWVGTAADFESLYPPNRHYVFIRRKTSEPEESTFTAYNSDYAAALQDLKMFIHGRLQVHPELQCELGFIWERLNALKAEHFA